MDIDPATFGTLDSCPACHAQWIEFVECYQCAGTGTDPETGEVCQVHSCAYNPETGKFDGECTPHCCHDGQRGPFRRVIGVEYAYTSPERYDGVSEWMCPVCEARWGRWSGRQLLDGEIERRFGGTPKFIGAPA